ncbi:ACT domain-containing protein [Acetivibrio saccincola]|jgi:aspartokinase|uniref:aspartate kinase n=1 Tax=Acetivibrio saccincola TaxID=1677857 RepID=A0A2K9EIH0_9FIRM|nr:ACT domain-containing protein [Acetivibrio saccincola]AUG57733.1 Aspartokinase [Acetivibrio saccincola]NLW27863.1 ACT domain-containing protein [Acetivibrio saccincola]PQQ67624.1 amino acid-binding protein [Acetivibrio saccincola]HOA97711.1 ACT domain-containing protein [Acetivibrio saccincola]HQD28711.1 ACT domain-containing protein [Acetivibrio saccincola]
MDKRPVTNIDVSYNVAMITLGNMPDDINLISEIFAVLSDEGINIDMVSKPAPLKGTVSISFTLPADDMVKAITLLNDYKKKMTGNFLVEVDAYNSKVSVYGEEMKHTPGVAARVFKALAKENIEVKLITTSAVDISCLVYERSIDDAVNSIKKEFSLE